MSTSEALSGFDGVLTESPTPLVVDSGPRRGGRRLLRRALIASDAVALFLAWLLTGHADDRGSLSADTVLWVGLGVMVLAFQHLYRARVSAAWTNETARLIRGMTIVTLVWMALVGPDVSDGLTTLRLAGAATVLLIASRAVYRTVLRRLRVRGDLVTNVVVVGVADEAAHLLQLLSDTPEAGFNVVGVVGPRAGWSHHGFSWLGDIDDVAGAIERSGAAGAIVETAGLRSDLASAAVHDLLEQGTRVQLSFGLRSLDHRRLTPRPIGHEPLLYLEAPSLSRLQRVMKRFVDLVGAGVGLLASFPLLVVAAALVKLEDGGPVLFRQTRVGRHGEPFDIWKLRTMTVDAEERQSELRAGNGRDGPLFKLHRDPRVTRVGRFLRAASIDEIPQFWNVLRGEMSLVGPRPALPHEVAAFDQQLLHRLDVRPGVTGLWQVEARESPSFAAYRRLDLYYVRNWSLELDLAILLATVATVSLRAVTALGRAMRGGAVAGPDRDVLE